MRRSTHFKTSGGSSYEPETIAYMNAIGVPNDSTATIYGKTGAQVWQLFNSCIMIAKNAGKLGDIYTWHPMYGTSPSTLGVNAIDVNSFTKYFYGSWSFSELGNQTDGSGTYAHSNFVPNVQMSLEDSGFTVASNTGFSVGSSENRVALGCRGGNGGYLILAIFRRTDDAQAIIGDNTHDALASVNTAEGVSTISRFSGTVKYVRNKTVLAQNNYSSGSLPNTPLYYGAYLNITEPPIAFEKQRLLSECIHKGDDATIDVVQQMIDTWEAGLNRKTW